MAAPDIIVLPLKEAVLCVDCEKVTNSKGDFCLFCGSRAVLSMSVVFDRQPELVECDA